MSQSPPASSAEVTARPTVPVAPMTAIRFTPPLLPGFVLELRDLVGECSLARMREAWFGSRYSPHRTVSRISAERGGSVNAVALGPANVQSAAALAGLHVVAELCSPAFRHSPQARLSTFCRAAYDERS
jgi:hypothetical protein